MNIKLICASLIGVSSIGGAVAGGMYLSKSKNDEAKTDLTTKTKPTEAEEEAPALTNTVTEQTGQNVGSSGSSSTRSTLPATQVAERTTLTSGTPTEQEPLRT